ncbi:MAG: pitrilysin family protein [Bacteroidota bacterium]
MNLRAYSSTVFFFMMLMVPMFASSQQAPRITEVYVPNSPLVSFRVVVRSGSINDPAGKEGLNALTATMIGQGGSRSLSYQQIVDKLYPWAARIRVQADKEETTIIGEVHRDHLQEFFGIFWELIASPRFDSDDFARNKDEQINYLKNTLRGNDDENLGKEGLNLLMYTNHPYRTAVEGTVQGLNSITLDDVRAFHHAMYSQSRIIFGIAGGYPKAFIEQVKKGLADLPLGSFTEVALPNPVPPVGVEGMIIQKENRATAISFGYPIDVTRADKDYYALLVANSYLGEHRTFNGVLMNHLRGDRGLNYGDYSYIENFIQDGGSTFPDPNIPRREQFFSVWIRPVEPKNAQFAIRAAMHEVQLLVDNGLTKEDFETTRNFLINYSKLWVQTQSRRLGYVMDSQFYGIPYYVDYVAQQLSALTVDEVNAAIKKHLQAKNYYLSIVAKDAGPLKEALLSNAPSPIQYNNPNVPAEILEQDKVIQSLTVNINKEKFRIVPSSELFEK